MEFGIYIPQVNFSYEDVLSRAVLCEELGIDSFWLYDHLYSPGLPDRPSLEGWTLATALLARTTRIRVGHLVIDNNLRHPALLARMATTLDVISGGRLELGIGSGSYEAEHHEGGFPWGTAGERFDRLEESLEILQRMFSSDVTSFAGDHFTMEGLPNRPAPVQSGGPRLIVGGTGRRRTLPMAARYAAVWNVPTYGLGEWEDASRALDEECERIGRDPSTLVRSVESVMVLGRDDAAVEEARARAARRYPGPGWGVDAGGFVGTPAAVVDRIGEMADKGVRLFVFFPSDRGEEEGLRLFAEEVVAALR